MTRTILSFCDSKNTDRVFLYDIRTYKENHEFLTICGFDEFLGEDYIRGVESEPPFNERKFEELEEAMSYHKAYIQTLKNRKNLIFLQEKTLDN